MKLITVFKKSKNMYKLVDNNRLNKNVRHIQIKFVVSNLTARLTSLLIPKMTCFNKLNLNLNLFRHFINTFIKIKMPH